MPFKFNLRAHHVISFILENALRTLSRSISLRAVESVFSLMKPVITLVINKMRALILLLMILSGQVHAASVGLNQVVTYVWNGSITTTSIDTNYDISNVCIKAGWSTKDYNGDGISDSFVRGKIGVNNFSSSTYGTAKRAVILKDFSNFSSAFGVCVNDYDRDGIGNANIVAHRVRWGSSGLCYSSNIHSHSVLVDLKKITNETQISLCQGYGDIPKGWVITHIDEDSSMCSPSQSSSSTLLTLEKIPSNGSIVTCGLPDDIDNYMVKPLSSSCSDNSLRYEVGGIVDGGYSCNVPQGMGVTRYQSYAGHGLSCNTIYTVEYPKNNHRYCSESSRIPENENWVVYNVANTYGPCGSRTAWDIKQAATGGIFCGTALPLPSAYGLINTSASYCGSSYWGGILQSLSDGIGGISTSVLPSSLPEGMIVTNVQNLGGNYFYTIDYPKSDTFTDFCYLDQYDGPLPSGYMLTGQNNTGVGCALGKTSRLEGAKDGLEACDIRNLPANFAISDADVYAGPCPSNRIRISELTGDGPYYICHTGTVPSGYVVTSVRQDDICSSFGGDFLTIVKPTGNMQAICPIQGWDNIPTDMAVFSTPTGVGCKGNRNWLIDYPNQYKLNQICVSNSGDYLIPAGYFMDSGPIYPNNCYEGRTIVVKTDFQAIDPASFVNDEPNVSSGNSGTINYDCGDSPQENSFLRSGSSRNNNCP